MIAQGNEVLLKRIDNLLHGSRLIAVCDGLEHGEVPVRGLGDFMELGQQILQHQVLLSICAKLQDTLHHARRIMTESHILCMLLHLCEHLLDEAIALFGCGGAISHHVPVHLQTFNLQSTVQREKQFESIGLLAHCLPA